jgi:hypothetical protein
VLNTDLESSASRLRSQVDVIINLVSRIFSLFGACFVFSMSSDEASPASWEVLLSSARELVTPSKSGEVPGGGYVFICPGVGSTLSVGA